MPVWVSVNSMVCRLVRKGWDKDLLSTVPETVTLIPEAGKLSRLTSINAAIDETTTVMITTERIAAIFLFEVRFIVNLTFASYMHITSIKNKKGRWFAYIEAHG